MAEQATVRVSPRHTTRRRGSSKGSREPHVLAAHAAQGAVHEPGGWHGRHDRAGRRADGRFRRVMFAPWIGKAVASGIAALVVLVAWLVEQVF